MPNVSPCLTIVVALPLRALPNVSATKLLDHAPVQKAYLFNFFLDLHSCRACLDVITSADSIPRATFPEGPLLLNGPVLFLSLWLTLAHAERLPLIANVRWSANRSRDVDVNYQSESLFQSESPANIV